MSDTLALVTGASSGIGAEFARQLAGEKIDLVLVARRADRLEELAAELETSAGIQCHVILRDLSQSGAAEELFAATERQGWVIEWLVNNAGFGTNGFFENLPLERELEEIRLNVESVVALSRLYLPGMLSRRRGRIVNLGSIGSFLPVPYMATYGATKAFVLSFSEALANELAGTGVGVLAVCPGATRTEFQQVAGVDENVPDFSYMSAEAVVRGAIMAAKAGRRLYVPGWMNKVSFASMKITPRRVTARVAATLFHPKSTRGSSA
jgi:short-subunit dehydrogenase